MQLGWIDFSKTERSKILSVLDFLSESGTLDELGIAPVRDGFSNFFFPGTSTIQTRAKYFLIVPYAFKQLEKSPETNPNQILKELDSIEHRCAKILYEQNQNENGIIGKYSLINGGWVKLTPANIYWSGLRKYRIFTRTNLSLSEYVRIFCAMKAQKVTLKKLGNRNDNAEENECDDKNAGDLFSMQFWKIPPYKDNWIKDLSIKLSKEEANFLKEQIVTSCKGSMLAYVLEKDIKKFTTCDSFKDIRNIIGEFPQDIQDAYRLASNFSDFIYVIRTVYNIIISNGKNEDANMELKKLKPMLPEIANIDIDNIFNRLNISNNLLLCKFLNQCREYLLSENFEELKKCIISREVQLKGSNRAKTKHSGELNPNEWFGGRQLDFRFYNARTIVRDIMESEDETNA